MPNIPSTPNKGLLLQNGKSESTAAQEPVMVELDSSSSEIECAPPGRPSTWNKQKSKYFETKSTEGSVKRKSRVTAKDVHSKRPCRTESPKKMDLDSPKIMTKSTSTDDIYEIPCSENERTLGEDDGAKSGDENYEQAERKSDRAYKEAPQREKEAKKERGIRRIKLKVKTYQSKNAMKSTNIKRSPTVEIMDMGNGDEGDDEELDVQKAIKLSLVDMNVSPPPPLYVDLENEPLQVPPPSLPLPFPDQISTIGEDEVFKALNITLTFERVVVNPFSKPAKVMVIRFPMSIVGQKLEYTTSNQCKSILFAWYPNTNMIDDGISLEDKRQHLATLMVHTATGAKGMGKVEIPEGWMLMPTLENLKRCDTGSGFSQRKHLIGVSKENNKSQHSWVVRVGISKTWEGWNSGWKSIITEKNDMVKKETAEGILYGNSRDADMPGTPSSSSFKKREMGRFVREESTISPTVKLSDLEINSVPKRHNPEPRDLGSPTKKMKSLWDDITEGSDIMGLKRVEKPKTEEVLQSDRYDESVKDFPVKNTRAQNKTPAKKTEYREALPPDSTPPRPSTRRSNRSRSSRIEATSTSSPSSPCNSIPRGSKAVRFRTDGGGGHKMPPQKPKPFGAVIGYDPQVKKDADRVPIGPVSPREGEMNDREKIMGNGVKMGLRLAEELGEISLEEGGDENDGDDENDDDSDEEEKKEEEE